MRKQWRIWTEDGGATYSVCWDEQTKHGVQPFHLAEVDHRASPVPHQEGAVVPSVTMRQALDYLEWD